MEMVEYIRSFSSLDAFLSLTGLIVQRKQTKVDFSRAQLR